MSTFTAGYFFSDTQLALGNTATSDFLHTLIDGASLTLIAKTEFISGTTVVEVGSSSPSGPRQGDVWYDTSLDFMKMYGWSHYDAPGVGFIGTNGSGVTIPQYAVVAVKTSGLRNVEACMTALSARAIGSASVTAADGSDVFVVSHGQYSVLVTGGAIPGDVLATSEFTGYSIKLDALTDHITNPDKHAQLGQAFGVALATCIGTGTCTAMIYR